jgi:hypothetical protein
VVGFDERGGVHFTLTAGHFNGWAFVLVKSFPAGNNLAKLSKYAMIIKMEN